MRLRISTTAPSGAHVFVLEHDDGLLELMLKEAGQPTHSCGYSRDMGEIEPWFARIARGEIRRTRPCMTCRGPGAGMGQCRECARDMPRTEVDHSELRSSCGGAR